MQITRNNQNFLSFKSISLDDKEVKESDNLIHDIQSQSNPDNVERLKTQLFIDVFQKHIDKEVSKKSSALYYKDDLLQEFYLKFFDILTGVKDITTEKILNTLNQFRTDNNVIRDDKRLDKISLNNKNVNDTPFTIESRLTENNLPVYASNLSDEEKAVLQENFQKIENKVHFTTREKEILKKYKENKSILEISKELGVSYTTVRYNLRTIIYKIQDSEGVLPEKFSKYTSVITEKYKLNAQEAKQLKQNFIDTPQLVDLDLDKIISNIENTSISLDINSSDYLKLGLKCPKIFSINPETLENHLIKLVEILSVKKDKIIKLVFKQPQIFCMNPETLENNIIKLAEKLKVSEKNIVKAGIRHPAIFCMKPETIVNNIAELVKKLKVSQGNLIKVGIKLPPIFTMKSETIVNTIKELAKILDIKKENMIKLALKQPNLFYQKPETIVNNITKLAKYLCVKKEDILKAAIQRTTIFCMKPETIVSNITNLAKMLNVSKEDIIEIALKYKVVFCIKPETAIKKIKIYDYYRIIQNKKHDTISVSSLSAERLYQKILSYLVKNADDLDKMLPSKDLIKYISDKNKIYEFRLPDHELKQEFIDFLKAFSEQNFKKQLFKFV